MNITKIRLRGLSDIDFKIRGALPSDSYILKGADGLGPSEVDVSITNPLYMSGIYQGRRPQNKEIVMRVGLNPNLAAGESVAGLRKALYGLLTPPPKSTGDAIDIQLMDGDTVVAHIAGYVKRFETVPFAKETDVQITIACPQAYFEAPSQTVILNPPVTKDASFTYFSITNDGDAPSGLVMSFKFTGTNSSVFQVEEGGAFGQRMSINDTFATGDLLTIDTRAGSRAVLKTLSGATDAVSILDALSLDSPWTQLHGGVNSFKINSLVVDWNLGITYTPTYWGI